MTDFGDSLTECEQAEKDFKELSMEFTEPNEGKTSFSQQLTGEHIVSEPPSGPVSVTTLKHTATRHTDEVSRRLYKVLYGYDVELMDSDSENVSVLPLSKSTDDEIHGDKKVEGQGVGDMKANEDVLISTLETDVYQTSVSGDLDFKSILGTDQTQNTTTQVYEIQSSVVQKTKRASGSLIQDSHVSTFEKVDVYSVDDAMLTVHAEYNESKTLLFRLNAPEDENVVSVESSTECEAPGHVACSNESIPEIIWVQSSSHDRSSSPEFAADTAVLLTDSRASSPESVRSMNELTFLAPDSPVPQFRPLSPLPPTVLPWEPDDAGQALVTALKVTPLLLSSEAEERPLTPMISNKMPFGRPLSQCSDNSGEGSISPQSLTFDIENRALSPESVILENVHWLFTSSDHDFTDLHELRTSSPESIGSTTARCWPEFQHPADEPFTANEFKSFSPESLSSDTDLTMALISGPLEDRPSSPQSVASVDEYKPLSPDSPIPEFAHNWPDSSAVTVGERSSSPESVCSNVEYGTMSLVLLSHEDRASSPASVASADAIESAEFAQTVCDSSFADHTIISLDTTKDKAPTLMELVPECDDDWVIISLSDIEESPPSPESVLDYRPATVEQTQTTAIVEEALEKFETTHESIDIEKSKTEEKELTSMSSKSIREYTMKHDEILSLVPNPQHVVTSTPTAEVSSGDEITEKLAHGFPNAGKSKEDVDNPVREKTKSVRKKKSKKITGTDEPAQDVTKYQTESIDCGVNTNDETQASDQTLPMETAYEESKLSLAFSTDVTKGQQVCEESSALVPQHHVSLSETDRSVPVYSLSYDGELWKLISQIRDPQYVGETFMSKIGTFQFSGTRTESYHANSDETDEDISNVLQSEGDSGSEYRPMSPESLMLLDSFRPDSSHSGKSVDSRCALTPDSPVPHFVASFSGPSQVYHRSVSNESILSDLEMETDLNSPLLSDIRRSSPDSVLSLNMYRPLSPESPVEDFGHILSDFSVVTILERSSSTVSLCSDIEYGAVSLSVCSEMRPSSPDSVVSGGDGRGDSPIPEFQTGLAESVSIIAHRSSSPESFISDVEYAESSGDIGISEQRPDSPEAQVSDTAEIVVGHRGQTLKAIRVPVYRLVYDAELWKLISQIQDPPYVGETFYSKTGVFEYAGTRIEYVLEERETGDDVKLDIGDSCTPEGEERPVSPLSDSEHRPLSPNEITSLSSLRPCSPESLQDLCLDSPVPQFSTDFVNSSHPRPYSPESAMSDQESESFMLTIFSESRTSSPRSVVSVDRDNELSIDSPVPDFRPSVPESVTAVFGYRSSSPESVISDIDYGLSTSEAVADQRAYIAKSVVLMHEHSQSAAGAASREHQLIRQLYDPHYLGDASAEISTEYVPIDSGAEDTFGPNSAVAGYRPLSSEALKSLSMLRSYSQGTENSMDENRSLSPDSPIPQFSVSLLEYPMEPRSPTSSEPASDIELEQCDDFVLEWRASSPESLCEHKSLSADSPVPDFGTELHYCFNVGVGSRASSPRSSSSDLEDSSGFIPAESWIQDRPGSPDSVSSKIDMRLHSPESVMDYRPMSPQSLMLTEIRTPCPGSTTSTNEFKVLSPDSPLPEFSLNIEPAVLVSGSRSSSPMSDIELEVLDTSCIEMNERPFTPDSEIESRIPDSPIPEFTQLMLPNVLTAEWRSTSPESVCISDIEYEDGLLAVVSDEHRPQSPYSIASTDEHLALPPDSPVPQFTAREVERFPTFVRFRSALPESGTSDVEYAPLVNSPFEFEDRLDTPESLETGAEDGSLSNFRSSSPVSTGSLNEFRALSADSLIPDFGQVLQESVNPYMEDRSSSPESASSDLEVEIKCWSALLEERPSSPDSVASPSKYTRLSPDSPIPEYSTALQVPCYEASGYRSSSPESESDTEFVPLISQLFEIQDRPDSPQSVLEYEHLSPDSPVPQYTHAEPCTLTLRCRSSSPGSQYSDEDLETDLYIPWTVEDRHESPDSTSSQGRPLSPDSPIPQFTQALHEPSISHINSRSSSPESEVSEIEYAPLISEMFEFEDRAESPQSGASDSDLRYLSCDSPIPQYTVIASTTTVGVRYRSTSPESAYSDNDLETNMCIPLLFEERPASPGSVASNDESRCLSPDSPIPQFTQALYKSSLSLVNSRSSSSESLLSDLEFESLWPMVAEGRPSSPESLKSQCGHRRLSLDSPVPDFRQALSEIYPDFNVDRPFTPESEVSEIEYVPLISEMFEFEYRAESPQSGASDSDLRCLSCDSPIPQYTMITSTTTVGVRYRSTSPESAYSDDDLETDLCIPLLFKERPASPGSVASNDESRCLSPDSPIPQFSQALYKSSISLVNSRSSSSESLLSDLEFESLWPVDAEGRPSSPESLKSQCGHRRLSLDSPVPDFRQALSEIYLDFNADRPFTPESEVSETEYAPLISEMFEFEDRAESPQSGASDSDLKRLSCDSPIPQYTMIASTTVGVRYRSTSPESAYSDNDLETDLCMPWLFEVRPASPGSVASGGKFRPLSPDSPIPQFTRHDCIISHINLRSTSPESLCSDLETDHPFPTLLESRPSSPESLTSVRLSPDSPIPYFVQPLFEIPETSFGHRSTSPESTCSDVEYIVIGLGSLIYNNRASSPESGGSGDEYQGLSPDSPIPEYRPAVPERVIINEGYRSSSPESIESDVEFALSGVLMSLCFGVEDRPDSPESAESEIQERSLSVESIPEYKPMSPSALMALRNIGSVSPESTKSLDEHARLSPESPLPCFTQNVPDTATAEIHSGSSSPQSILSDTECDLTYSAQFDMRVSDERTQSPQSESLYDECKNLSSESPIPDFTGTFVENVINVRNMSPVEFSDTDDLSQTSASFCAEERASSPESIEPDVDKILTLTSPSDDSAIMVAEYSLTYDAEMWKLISQIRDPQYAGETFNSKTGFMQFLGSKVEYERSIPGDVQVHQVEDKNDQGATAEQPHLEVEVTHQLTTTDTNVTGFGLVCTSNAHVKSDIAISESLPPMIENTSGAVAYRQTKYTFECPRHDAQTESEAGTLISVSDTESDDLCYSSESSIDYRPMSPNSVMFVETRASSPESVKSVNEFRSLSPDSPIPMFTVKLPEIVEFLRSISSSPERDRRVSCESLPEYRPMSFESAMYMVDRRASTPESMPEFNENRSLSPDSPIPQFSIPLEEFFTTNGSSSPESLGSDSEWELVVTSSRVDDTNRPSSPESISSVNEFRRLLPDSPVPVFMRILSSYFMDDTANDRSSSPDSLSSDSKFVALPIDCWIDDSPRPMSPESIESDEELCFSCECSESLVSTSEHLSHVELSLRRNESCERKSDEEQFSPGWQLTRESQSDISSYEEWIEHGLEAGRFSTVQTTVCEESFGEDLSPVKDVKRKEEKTKTASQRDPLETTLETQIQTEYKMQGNLLCSTTATQDASNIGARLSDGKPMTTVALQLPDQNLYTTHRTVTPVLPTYEKTSCAKSDTSHRHSQWELSPKEAQTSELFSPMSTEFLVPPDYEDVFSGYQTLRVSECSQATLEDLSPVSSVFSDTAQVTVQSTTERESETAEDLEFSPDFNRVLSEFEKTASEFESPKVPLKERGKGSASPQHSDSDVEFFDCRQALSDFSEPEDVKLERDIAYHICEPPSPIHGGTPDIGFLKGTHQYTAHPFLQVEDYKRFSSGSESLGEFAYDSEASREIQAEGLTTCEELPSRDQAGYYDDDDFLGREIAEELGMLSSDSSEEEVLTTRVVRRRVIIQADSLPDIPAQTVTEEKYMDEHGNMVTKKIMRKVIRKYVSADGTETQEVTIEGSHQETVQIEEGDTVSRVVRRTVLRSDGDQKELTFSEPMALGAATPSEFEVEPVQGRKVSKVVKTTVVRGERMEKQTGDPSLAADLPSAREDFEKKPDA
ncbi:ankyrin-2b isoform X1 [Mugil cephalus]|uniref:ankyrin-2b isoform X1 n=1 Tax=Mugil cephalus TaxID=48193 RepID=UPI001FB61E48|nr:ankyrin-2b isoform X1 [Mugil cephalus]